MTNQELINAAREKLPPPGSVPQWEYRVVCIRPLNALDFLARHPLPRLVRRLDIEVRFRKTWEGTTLVWDAGEII